MNRVLLVTAVFLRRQLPAGVQRITDLATNAWGKDPSAIDGKQTALCLRNDMPAGTRKPAPSGDRKLPC